MTKHRKHKADKVVSHEHNEDGYSPALYPVEQSKKDKALNWVKSVYKKFHSSGFDVLVFPTVVALVFTLFQYIFAKALYLHYFNLSQYLLGLNNVLFVWFGVLILEKFLDLNISEKVYKFLMKK